MSRTSGEPNPSPGRESDRREQMSSLWDAIGQALRAEHDRIKQEIASYPTPIAGCDQQFNNLLEQQARFSAEWERLEAARHAVRQVESSAVADSAATNPQAGAREFLAACSLLDAVVKAHLLR